MGTVGTDHPVVLSLGHFGHWNLVRLLGCIIQVWYKKHAQNPMEIEVYMKQPTVGGAHVCPESCRWRICMRKGSFDAHVRGIDTYKVWIALDQRLFWYWGRSTAVAELDLLRSDSTGWYIAEMTMLYCCSGIEDITGEVTQGYNRNWWWYSKGNEVGGVDYV